MPDLVAMQKSWLRTSAMSMPHDIIDNRQCHQRAFKVTDW